MITNVKFCLLVILSVCALSPQKAEAQQTCSGSSLEFTNAPQKFCVELKNPSSVKHLSNGSFLAECKLSSDGSKCDGVISGGSGSTGPGAKINSFASTASVVPSNTPFKLNWSVSDASFCKLNTTNQVQASSSSGMNSIGSNLFIPTQATGNFEFSIYNSSLTNDADYNFTMTCYADGGNATSSTLTVKVEKSPQAVASASCEALKNALRAAGRPDLVPEIPAGLTRDTGGQTFTQVFRDKDRTITYPEADKEYGVNIPSAKSGMYMAVDIFPKSGFWYRFSSIEATWTRYTDVRNPINSQGWPINGNSYWTLSPCQGDFRKPVAYGDAILSVDPSLSPACRKGPESNNKITYTVNGPASFSECNLKGASGQKFYWNAIMSNPDLPLDRNNTTCRDDRDTCHNNIGHTDALPL